MGWMKKTRILLPENLGKVLEVGSLDINGSAKEVYSQADSYIGIDMRDGKGVDIKLNSHNLLKKFKTKSFDVVIWIATLEHDNKFWLSLEAINKVLKKDGYLVFCAPAFEFPIHDYPGDYWRVSKQAVKEVIMEKYKLLETRTIIWKRGLGHEGINKVICAIGKKL